MLKDLKEWIKPPPFSPLEQVPLALWRLPRERGALAGSRSKPWAPLPRAGTGARGAAPAALPPRLLHRTLTTFQQDLLYLCCASVGKALNKYFT